MSENHAKNDNITSLHNELQASYEGMADAKNCYQKSDNFILEDRVIETCTTRGDWKKLNVKLSCILLRAKNW